ncbi:MAG TPA: GDL motif peptide-associated radical SAM/SPASM maturase [Pyrinomonadaceae bacterium]|nr:GDL motif peptide-associated radical SAM/SPASM maturase [Pyrinomonadaceae bacterium]
MAEPTRYFTPEDRGTYVPVHVVWEITLACDLKCQHCGSRAGRRRPDELSTAECLDVVRQLARLGTREVTLIGGEAYMRPDWLEIVREVRAQGMDCTMQTGGLHLNEERVRRAAEAGLQGAGVSVDGLRELHDELRGVKGSFDAALRALSLLRAQGITPSVNTQISARVIKQLPELCELFVENGAKNWQVQLTVAMGRAADHPELLLQPYQLLELMPLLADLYRRSADGGMLLQPGNNVGYFGPYESLWRGSGDERIHWPGCNAGQNTMGIEADGTVKGCPSLPTVGYAGGNVRELSMEDIWRATPELNFNLTRDGGELWGFCRDCYYADSCRGGCTWLSHSLLGRPGNNPYCHHRALELERRGLREHVRPVEAAPGTPFDHGRFELLLETLDGRPAADALALPAKMTSLVQIERSRTRAKAKPSETARKPVALKTAATTARTARTTTPALVLCRACNRHVKSRTHTCPHCGADVRAAARAYDESLRDAREACLDLLALLPPS